VIELDDASHEEESRRDRDTFVDAALTAAGLPILHIPAQRADIPAELAAAIQQSSRETSRPATRDISAGDISWKKGDDCVLPNRFRGDSFTTSSRLRSPHSDLYVSSQQFVGIRVNLWLSADFRHGAVCSHLVFGEAVSPRFLADGVAQQRLEPVFAPTVAERFS